MSIHLDEFLSHNPANTAPDVKEEMDKNFPENLFSLSTIRDKMSKLDFTIKRMRYVASSANSPLNKAIRADYATWKFNNTNENNSFTYVDEAGCNMRTLKVYGYSKRGQRACMEGVNSRTTNISMLMAVSPEFGLVHMETCLTTIDGTRYAEFLSNVVRSLQLKPDFRNYEKHYIVMDNAPIHRVEEVSNVFLTCSNVYARMLPPFSPMLNPIEEAWSLVKHYIRKGLTKRQKQPGLNENKTDCYTRINVEEINKSMVHVTLDYIKQLDKHARTWLPSCLAQNDLQITRRPEDMEDPLNLEVILSDKPRDTSFARLRRESFERRIKMNDADTIEGQYDRRTEIRANINATLGLGQNKRQKTDNDDDNDDA